QTIILPQDTIIYQSFTDITASPFSFSSDGVVATDPWQGDGPLREPSPHTQGVLCAVVNH
ncbi:hypothetical protein, partial [Pseudomonas aeruginosa]|uniref:hypothetical protein n=1 Tax=Pseudomonas aeruginosa TaxID=287 RepID=UPI000EB34BA7